MPRRPETKFAVTWIDANGDEQKTYHDRYAGVMPDGEIGAWDKADKIMQQFRKGEVRSMPEIAMIMILPEIGAGPTLEQAGLPVGSDDDD